MRFHFLCSAVILTAAGGLIGQVPAPTFEQRQSIGQTWIQFSQCMSRSDAGCLLSFASTEGISVGLDQPRISKEEFKEELRAENSMQCFFWADRCGRKSTNLCSLSRYTQSGGQAPRYSKPIVQDGHWQVEVIVPHLSDRCEQDLQIIFRLEEGLWRIVAIPYA